MNNVTLSTGVENCFTELSRQPRSPGRPVRMKNADRETNFDK